MRALIQRVSSARVEVDGEVSGAIGAGLLVLLGVRREDTEAEADALLDKLLVLRVFEDAEGKMNLSLLDTGGALLVAGAVWFGYHWMFGAAKVVYATAPVERGNVESTVVAAGVLQPVKYVDVGLLVVSQFTLYGDTRKGRRPSFDLAAPPEQARRLYERFVAQARGRGVATETGVFRAHMLVTLVGDGPVTLMLETKNG